MRIAFVGKGGSGKTTLAASFIRFLQSKNIFTLAIDADINVGLASSLGIVSEKGCYLSDEKRVRKIRKYLIGNNLKIASVEHMVKTTPPGTKKLLFSLSVHSEKNRCSWANSKRTLIGELFSRMMTSLIG